VYPFEEVGGNRSRRDENPPSLLLRAAGATMTLCALPLAVGEALVAAPVAIFSQTWPRLSHWIERDRRVLRSKSKAAADQSRMGYCDAASPRPTEWRPRSLDRRVIQGPRHG
jgi:hypothetical protein